MCFILIPSPYYIPLIEQESIGPFGTLADVSVRSSRYPALRQPDKHCRTASRSGPGALRAQGTSTGAGRRQRQRPVGPAACPYRDDRTVTGGRNCSVKVWKTGRSAPSPQRSSPISSASPPSRQRSGCPSRTGQPRVLASRETPLHGWRTDHIVPTARVSSPHSAPSPMEVEGGRFVDCSVGT